MAKDGQYKLSCAEKHREQLRVWTEKAASLGIGDQFADAVIVINTKLKTEPLEWGDPQYRYHHLDLLVCHGMHAMLHVYYAVDEQEHIVYVQEFRLQPGHPLSSNQ